MSLTWWRMNGPGSAATLRQKLTGGSWGGCDGELQDGEVAQGDVLEK
jgi:hypothetical protein